MKKDLLIYQIALGSFMLSFSSCINQDFDIDDDKLDKNVTIGNSINLPIGDIEKITVYDQIKELYKDLEVDDNGTLYIEYGGTFPVKFPEYDIPDIEDENKRKEINKFVGEVPLPPSPTQDYKVDLIEEATTEYVLTIPELDDLNIQFDPKRMVFNALTLNVDFELSGIHVEPEDSGAGIEIKITFSKHYGVDGTDQTKTYNIDFAGDGSLGQVIVNTYTFYPDEAGTLTYSLALKTGNATKITVEEGAEFNLKLSPANPKPDIEYIECSIKGENVFSGEVENFDKLQDAFGTNDVALEFNSPSLALRLTTNLGTDFKLGFDMKKTVGSEEVGASLGDNLLEFENSGDGSAKTQSYALTPENMVGLGDIISTPFPTALNYDIRLKFEEDEAKLFPSNPLVLSANYKFKIPFDFNNIDLRLKETITNLFSEDTYDQVFSYTDDVTIEADNVAVNIGGGNIKLDIIATILDSKSNPIINLDNVLKNDKLSIAIKGDDLEKMKEARHLEFTFRLHGSGAIKNTDSIEIKGLRLKSGSGIHYEF
jgi:hypothetical protein